MSASSIWGNMGNLASAIGAPSEESLLVAELQAGSEDAFAWLIAKYQQPVFSLLARMVQDRADAADITQEVFVKVFRGVRGFHGQSSLRTWIYRIALNEASNQKRWWARHKKREVTIEGEADWSEEGEALSLKDLLIDPSLSPFEQLVSAEAAARVEAALQQLPEPYRAAVVLRDIEGFAYEEMAEILAVNLGTVKSRLARGRSQLKGCMRPGGPAAARGTAGREIA